MLIFFFFHLVVLILGSTVYSGNQVLGSKHFQFSFPIHGKFMLPCLLSLGVVIYLGLASEI